MRLTRSDVFTAGQLEREEGVDRDSLAGGEARDARTGFKVGVEEMPDHWGAGSIEGRLLLPDRVREMCADLFQRLLASGGPEQKTLIFCASDEHADRVAAEMGNLYAAWAADEGRRPADPYAFKCTAAGGRDLLAQLKGNQARAFVACTVELISTGVDVPSLRNVVFFRYLKSPILFHQMLGRGTRIDETTGKLHFTVHDYTNASRLLDQSLAAVERDAPIGGPEPGDAPEPTRTFEVERIPRAGRARRDAGRRHGGRATALRHARRVPRAHRRAAARRGRRARRVPRALDPARGARRTDRRVARRGRGGRGVPRRRRARGLRPLRRAGAGGLGGDAAHARRQRAERVQEAAGEPIIRVLAGQFGLGGTEALESGMLGQVPALRDAGGLPALARLGGDAMPDLKRRLLATDDEWSAP